MIQYRYVHSATEATTGYFACEPDPVPPLDEALALLCRQPLDDFLRRHIIGRMASLDAQEAASALRHALHALNSEGPQTSNLPPALFCLAKELVVLHPDWLDDIFFTAIHSKAWQHNAPDKPEPHSTAETTSPLIFLRWNALPDKDAHRLWVAFFNRNQREHRAIKVEDTCNLPPLYPAAKDMAGLSETPGPGTSPAFSAPFSVSLPTVYAEHNKLLPGTPTASMPSASMPTAQETAALAEDRLFSLDIIAGEEMRHTASLSPVALLRPWHVRLGVTSKRHHFSLEGQGTTYGRGLSVAQARVSCLMEMVERASAYVSVDENSVTERSFPCPLLYGSRSDILNTHTKAIDPNDFPLEVPYADEALHWIQGHGPGNNDADTAIWVPLQMAALFCNLDEISLMDAPGSTGIATGASMEQAKCAALLEIFERDAEATTLFTKADCFKLAADASTHPREAALLADYAARGINVLFQDITGPMGVPVYQAFVVSLKGAVARGHGAGLSGAAAAISALTETPFPYPDGGPSGPMLRKMPTRMLHELPDFSLPTHADALALLEDLLIRNGRAPVYVPLTRQGLDFPVVRAFIPGMELTADRDIFSRIPLRLYQAYEALLAR